MAEQVLTFGPFSRSVTAVEAHVAPPDAMADGSTNMLVDPVAGGAFKRAGSSIAGSGQSVNSSTGRSTVGILQSAIDWIPARLRSFYSDALYDGVSGGYPAVSVLYRREASSTSWPSIDDGVFGTEYVMRPNANYQLLSEYGGTAYPTSGGSHGAEIKYKVVPFWYESGEGGYSRGAGSSTDFTARFVASGSWSTVDAGRWRFYPNLRSTPLRWDGGCNDSASSISNAIRVTPTGPFAPLWAPTVATGTSGGVVARSTTYPWLGGDRFYVSVMGRRRDGSYTQPTYPVLVTVNSGALTTAYTHITYQNIPIMDDDVEARVILRSLKQTVTTATDALTVSLNDMRIVGTLRNNTQTSYLDIESDDDSLLQDTDAVRWDLICPPRARYYGTGDQRVIAGYTLPNPSAFQLSCIGIAAAYDQNLPDTSASISGATAALYRITTTGIDLIVAAAGAALATTTVDWATYDTVKKVVDQINTTVRDATHGQWRAQVAPGADPYAASTGICPTVWTGVSSTSAASTTLTIDAATLALIPIGAKIYDSAGKISAGTFVVKKLSSTTLELSAAASGSGSAAGLVFYCECGDEAAVTTAGSKGWIRTFGSAYPGMAYFKRSALPGYDKPAKERVYFTISSPGAAATGVSLAGNAWAATNRRDGLGNAGQIMGIVDVEGAAIICYARKIGLFINERGANTGEDFDIRIKPINNSMGCVSPWGVEGVAGCAVYPTMVGVKAADKSRKEVLLSADEYQPARGTGTFAYEIGQCIAAAGADNPDCWMGVGVRGNRLVYSYRRNASAFGFSEYDFSKGADQNGVDALADPVERRAYGWSSMCYLDQFHDEFGPRAMGAVQQASGLVFYGALNDNYAPLDGRVDKLFSGETDNGSAIIGQVNTKQYIAPTRAVFSAQSVSTTHKVQYASGQPTVSVSRMADGSTLASHLVTLTGSNPVTNEDLPLSQPERSPGGYAQAIWYDDKAHVGGHVWQLDLAVDVLPKVGG